MFGYFYYIGVYHLIILHIIALLDTFFRLQYPWYIFWLYIVLYATFFRSEYHLILSAPESRSRYLFIFKLPYNLILFQDTVHFANWHPCIRHDDLVASQTSILPLHTMHTHACFLIYGLMMYVCFNAVPRFKQWIIVCLAGLQSRGCNGIVFERRPCCLRC